VNFEALYVAAKVLNVEDADFANHLTEGAPLGIREEIPLSNGIWPSIPKKSDNSEPDELLSCHSMTRSAMTNKKILWKIISDELSEGWITPCKKSESLASVKLSILEKVRPDGSSKYRLIQNFTGNGVNKRCKLTETISLPRLKDVRRVLQTAVDSDMIQKDSNQFENIWCAELDVKSAFRLIPVRKTEQPFLFFDVNCSEGNFAGVHTRLPFGLRVSPYIFSRFAAILVKFYVSYCRIHYL
jgi:hypothetical protein